MSALKELRVTKHFRDVTLQNAVLNATYAAAIESELPSEAVFQALGAGAGNDEALANYVSTFLGSVSEYSSSGNQTTLNGVRIPHLHPGTKLHLHPAGKGGPLGSEFEQSLLRYISSSLGVSYEQLSRDYTKTNYSSARAAINETWKFMQARKRIVADRFASHVYRLWLEEAMNTGQVETLNGKQDVFYTGGSQNLMWEALTACDWIGASRGQIDELKETQAAVMRVRHGLSTIEDETARLGKDWRKVLAQREREVIELRERGLEINPKDNAVNAASGDTREASDDPSEDETDDAE